MDLNKLTAEDLKNPSVMIEAMNSIFKEYRDAIANRTTKEETEKLQAQLIVKANELQDKITKQGDFWDQKNKEIDELKETIKIQGGTIAKMKDAWTPEDRKVSFGEKIREFSATQEFKDFALGNKEKARFELQFKDVAFTGTYGSSAVRQAYMPFEVPQGPDMESFDVRVVVPTGTTDSTSLQYPTERAASLTDATATKAENTALAESTMGFTMGTATAQKLGAFIEVSRAALRNTAWLETYINGRLLAMWIKALNSQVIAGGGTGTDLSGLVTNQNAFSTVNTALSAAFTGKIANANEFDVLNAAKGAMNAYYYLNANTYFLNPVDHTILTSSKNTIANFIDPATFLQRNNIGYTGAFGMRAISSADITAGNYLVAAIAPENMQLLFNGPIEILMTDSHASNFIADLVTIKIQGYAMLPIYKSGSLIGGTLATDKGTINSGA